MSSSRHKAAAFSALAGLSCLLTVITVAWLRVPGTAAHRQSSPARAAAVAPATLGFARLSASQRRQLAAVENLLRSAPANDGETILWQTLPDLLCAGGAPLLNRLLAETPPGALREALLRICEIQWPKVDPAAALAWVATLTDPAARREAFERVLSSLATVDPARAVQVSAHRDASGETDGTLTSGLVTAWAASDLSAARHWTLDLPSGERRDACVARVATVEARNFPAAAARFALKRLPPGPILDETVVTTVYFWAGRNEAEARRWVENFPAGPLRDRVLAEVNHSAATADYHPANGQP